MTDLVSFIVPRTTSPLMKSLCVLLLLGFVTQGHCAQGGRPFHVYAPSHTTGKLLVATATPSPAGLELKLAQEIKLGFPASVITKHPTKPLLYVAPPGGPEGKGDRKSVV